MSTAFVDNTVRDIIYALRGLRRAPLVAFTIVSTVALGLGLVAVAFTFLNTVLFQVDRVPHVDEMFAVDRPQASEADHFTRAHLDALRRETDIFTDAYAEISGIDFPVDGRKWLFTLVSGNFFRVAGVNAALGRTLLPADDEPFGGRAVMVLSDRGWNRLFSRDPAVVGRTVLVRGVSYEIVGVMPEGFRGLSIVPPDYWVPLSMVGHLQPVERGREADAGVRIVGRLKQGLTREAAVTRLAAWAVTQSNRNAIERAAAGITLIPWRGTIPQPLEAMLVTGPLFFSFGLILLIACANVTNLLFARAVARQREIGIRLSLGAARARIVRQLLTESLLLALMAAAIGFAISRVVMQVIVNAIVSSWPPEIGDVQLLTPDADWRVILFLLAGAVASTVCFGLFPALRSTRIEPTVALRGEVVKEVRPGTARTFLIGLQVSASALLLISAAIFLRSAFVAAAFDPGIRTSDTVMIGIANEAERTAIVQAVTTEPTVAAMAASWPAVLASQPAAFAETTSAKSRVGYAFVSSEYFSVFDIALVRGRTFGPDERTPSLPVAIVSETAARTMWPNGDAVGQTMRLGRNASSETRDVDEPSLEPGTYTVIGVVRDVAGFRFAPLTKAAVYLPANPSMPRTALIARVYGNPELARQSLLNRLTAIDPNIDQVGLVGSVTRMETYLLRLAFWFTVGLGGLALALTLSGLFSVLSYLVEQRSREIGVRMALGATSLAVTRLVLSQSFRPVGIGLAIGGGSAAAISAVLLTTPAAEGLGAIVRVLDPVAYGTSLLIIMTACLAAAAIPAARAARLDPSQTLRRE